MQKHLKSSGSAKKSFGSSCLTEQEIIGYLFHRMTDEERFRIENHFTECDLCYDAVTGARKFKTEDELRRQVEAVQQDIQKKYRRSVSFLHGPKLMYYSAAALVLIAFSGLGYWMARDPNRQLADEFIRPYSNTIPLSRSQNQLTLLEEAMSDYESENYVQSKVKLDQFLEAHPDHLTAHLYCGISALICGETPEALIHLEKASGSSETRISEAARWYEGLAYLKLGKANSAAVILKEIGIQGGYFSESAQSILMRMKIE